MGAEATAREIGMGGWGRRLGFVGTAGGRGYIQGSRARSSWADLGQAGPYRTIVPLWAGSKWVVPAGPACREASLGMA